MKNKKKNLEEKTVSYKPSSGENTSRAKLKRKNNTFPSFPLGGKALPHRAKKKRKEKKRTYKIDDLVRKKKIPLNPSSGENNRG